MRTEKGNTFGWHLDNSFSYVMVLVASRVWTIHTTLLRLLRKVAPKTASLTNGAEHIMVCFKCSVLHVTLAFWTLILSRQ